MPTPLMLETHVEVLLAALEYHRGHMLDARVAPALQASHRRAVLRIERRILTLKGH